MKNKVMVEIRQNLWDRLVEISDAEGMEVSDLVDHALRSYAEGYEFDGDDEEVEE